VTDCYQPAERRFRLTRQCLEVLARFRNPAVIVTKSALVRRDKDLLVAMAEQSLVQVCVTITTLDESLQEDLEPRAARPRSRLEAVRDLSEAGIPVHVLVSPVIPGLSDHEIP